LGRLLALLQAQSTQAQHLPQPLLNLKLAPALLGLRRAERLLCAGLHLTLPKLCATELLFKLRGLSHAVRFELLEILRRRQLRKAPAFRQELRPIGCLRFCGLLEQSRIQVCQCARLRPGQPAEAHLANRGGRQASASQILIQLALLFLELRLKIGLLGAADLLERLRVKPRRRLPELFQLLLQSLARLLGLLRAAKLLELLRLRGGRGRTRHALLLELREGLRGTGRRSLSLLGLSLPLRVIRLLLATARRVGGAQHLVVAGKAPERGVVGGHWSSLPVQETAQGGRILVDIRRKETAGHLGSRLTDTASLFHLALFQREALTGRLGVHYRGFVRPIWERHLQALHARANEILVLADALEEAAEGTAPARLCATQGIHRVGSSPTSAGEEPTALPNGLLWRDWASRPCGSLTAHAKRQAVVLAKRGLCASRATRQQSLEARSGHARAVTFGCTSRRLAKV
jgi:hypothetical protein